MGRFEEPLADARLRTVAARVALFVFDFDGVFTDNAVYVFEDGREAVRCSRSDGIGLRRVEAIGVQTLIVSTETNPVVTARGRKLQVECFSGVGDKLALLGSVLAERALDFERCAYLGNDVNDLACLERCALPIVPQDAHPDVVPAALYRTAAPGGHGAVREACDLLVALRGATSDAD